MINLTEDDMRKLRKGISEKIKRDEVFVGEGINQFLNFSKTYNYEINFHLLDALNMNTKLLGQGVVMKESGISFYRSIVEGNIIQIIKYNIPKEMWNTTLEDIKNKLNEKNPIKI